MPPFFGNIMKDTDTIQTKYKGMELSVGEIKNSNRIQKSATPKMDLSWYVKWASSIFILGSMSIRGVEGLQQYDLGLSLIGVAGWLWVGLLWKDRALILLNGIGVFLFLNTLIKNYWL